MPFLKKIQHFSNSEKSGYPFAKSTKFISRAILLHKLLHSGELPPLPSPCCALQSTKFLSLQSLINDGFKWRDCINLPNCCLSFGETVKANVLILIKVICSSRNNAMNTRNIFTTEHRCVTSQAIYVDVSNQ